MWRCDLCVRCLKSGNACVRWGARDFMGGVAFDWSGLRGGDAAVTGGRVPNAKRAMEDGSGTSAVTAMPIGSFGGETMRCALIVSPDVVYSPILPPAVSTKISDPATTIPMAPLPSPDIEKRCIDRLS